MERHLFTNNASNMIISLDLMVKSYDLKIKGVLHIGAHYGQEYGVYADKSIKNMIFFEPVMANYKELVARVPMVDGIRTLNIALGNTTGEMEMFVETKNLGMSCSLLEPGTHLNLYPAIVFDKREKVKIDKLDNIEFDRSLFNMINIDVQGYELEVFKGAVETLKTIDIVYAEVNTEEVYKGCGLIGDIDKFLEQFGFKRVMGAFPYGKAWGDALYLKQK